MNTITLEGVNFNADHLGKMTKEEFLREFETTKVFKAFDAAPRKKLLEEAHKQCVSAIKKTPEKPVENPSTPG